MPTVRLMNASPFSFSAYFSLPEFLRAPAEGLPGAKPAMRTRPTPTQATTRVLSSTPAS